jgi:hypothetical protein
MAAVEGPVAAPLKLLRDRRSLGEGMCGRTNRLLVRHFLTQFIENDVSPEIDRHHVLALAAAALITLPLFVTMFMGVKYLMRPLQAPGWTATTAAGDAVTFCAASMLVSAILATLEWESLALTPRDSFILGVLPIPRPEIVRAKLAALVTFAAAFVIALNALPTLLHPALMVANLPLNVLMLLPLMSAHALSTIMAGALGFAAVVAVREGLFLALGPQRFRRIGGLTRSALLLLLLVLLALVPIRLSGNADWMFASTRAPVLLRPVGWFAATDAVITGRVLEHVADRDLPDWMSAEELELRRLYWGSLPALTRQAALGTLVLGLILGVSFVLFLWNARRLHVLPEGRRAPTLLPRWRVGDRVSILPRPAKRAGLLFFVKTLFGNAVHRLYLIASCAAAVALLLAMAPSRHESRGALLDTGELALQTLILAVLIAGLRACLRTSADQQASWVVNVADTGTLRDFRDGVRLGVLGAIVITVVVLIPVHAAAWGWPLALPHALNGALAGWLLAEAACGTVEEPLIATIPPNDGLNTIGVVFLGAIVILVFVLARIERVSLTTTVGSGLFPSVMLLLAVVARQMNRRSAANAGS